MTYLLDIMHAMGLDPSRTTKEELEACPARLTCQWCESSRARYYAECNDTPPACKGTIYSWEAAVRVPVPMLQWLHC